MSVYYYLSIVINPMRPLFIDFFFHKYNHTQLEGSLSFVHLY